MKVNARRIVGAILTGIGGIGAASFDRFATGAPTSLALVTYVATFVVAVWGCIAMSDNTRSQPKPPSTTFASKDGTLRVTGVRSTADNLYEGERTDTTMSDVDHRPHSTDDQ